jgi:RNA polymerase sigma-70 factor (ECF subfamily)
MSPTSISLLDRLRVAKPDDSAWLRLHDIYLPLIHRWIGRVPGVGDEAADLAQEILIVMVRKISQFERQREGSFRAWLRQVTVNQLRNHRRKQHRQPAVGLESTRAFLDRLAEPNSELAREWDLDHDRHVFQKLQAAVHDEFAPSTWEAFHRFAVDGLPPAQVAEELGLSINAVTLAKSRILKRLREEAGDLLT